jgi:hypothetical protein
MIELPTLTRGFADGLARGERTLDGELAHEYPTEFSLGMAAMAGRGSLLGPWPVVCEDGVVGDIGGGLTGPGQVEIRLRSCPFPMGPRIRD